MVPLALAFILPARYNTSDVDPPPPHVTASWGINVFLCVAPVTAKSSIYGTSNYLGVCGRSFIRETINCFKHWWLI